MCLSWIREHYFAQKVVLSGEAGLEVFEGLASEVGRTAQSVGFFLVEGVVLEVVVNSLAESAHNKLTFSINSHKQLNPHSYSTSSSTCLDSNKMFKRIKSHSDIQHISKQLFRPVALLRSQQLPSQPSGSTEKNQSRLQGGSRKRASRSSKELFREARSVSKEESLIPRQKSKELIVNLRQREEYLRLKQKIIDRAQQQVAKKLNIQDSLLNRSPVRPKLRLVYTSASEFKPKQEDSESLGQYRKEQIVRIIQKEQKIEVPLLRKGHEDREFPFSQTDGRSAKGEISAVVHKELLGLKEQIKQSIRMQIQGLQRDNDDRSAERGEKEREMLLKEVSNKISSQLEQKQQFIIQVTQRLEEQVQQLRQALPKEDLRPREKEDMARQIQQCETNQRELAIPKSLKPEGPPERISQQVGRSQQGGAKVEWAKTQEKKISKEATRKKEEEEVDSIFCDDLQEINLVGQSKAITKQFSPKNKANMPKEIDRSFNVAKNLNSSFESEQPKPNKAQLKKQEESRGQKEAERRKEEEAKRRKEELKVLLTEQNRADPLLTCIGEVVGYCSKALKKSKVEWRVPSLLLYRYCYDCYRSHTGLYEEGFQVGLFREEQVENFKRENLLLRQNMFKILGATTKRVELKDSYRQIIQSEEIQLERLVPMIENQVLKFIRVFCKLEDAGDSNSVKCALRMANSVFIIRKLTTNPATEVFGDVDSLTQGKARQALEEWARRLEKMLGK